VVLQRSVRAPLHEISRADTLSMYVWTVALATDAMELFSTRLGQRWIHCYRRTLAAYPATCTCWAPSGLMVGILSQRLRSRWEPLVLQLHRDSVSIPWLQNLKSMLCLDRPPGYRNRQSLYEPLRWGMGI
jgi:hypothetical protein